MLTGQGRAGQVCTQTHIWQAAPFLYLTGYSTPGTVE